MRNLFRRLQPLFRSEPGGVFILAYHLLGAGTSSPVDIDLDVFRRQMDQIRNKARICTLAEAVDSLTRGSETVEPRVVVTFDDAYENFYTHAWPVMSDLAIPSTLYVPVDFVSGKTRAPIASQPGLAACSWTQLSEMVGSKLLSIGSHSCSHEDLRRLDPEKADAEISESRRILQEKLGVTVDSFCYPKSLWSRRLESMVRNHYNNAVIAGGRRMHSGRWNPYRLNRVPIRRDMPVDLEPLLRSSLWLEEFLLSRARLWT